MRLIMEGGWVMGVLLGLSITAFAIVIQKLILLRETRIHPLFLDQVKTKLGSANSAKELLKDLRHATSTEHKIAIASIEHHQLSSDALAHHIGTLTKPKVEELVGYMSVLSLIATTAPVFGLLGTVLGLMDVFSVLAIEGVQKAELLSGGISKALITTVSGLSLAIPLMFIHQAISEKINKRLDQWDAIPAQILMVLTNK